MRGYDVSLLRMYFVTTPMIYGDILNRISPYIATANLVFMLAWHNFVNRYRNSYMGLLWIVAYPLTSAAVLWFVFTQAFKVQPPKGGIPFIVWLLGGMAAWNFFAGVQRPA